MFTMICDCRSVLTQLTLTSIPAGCDQSAHRRADRGAAGLRRASLSRRVGRAVCNVELRPAAQRTAAQGHGHGLLVRPRPRRVHLDAPLLEAVLRILRA